MQIDEELDDMSIEDIAEGQCPNTRLPATTDRQNYQRTHLDTL